MINRERIPPPAKWGFLINIKQQDMKFLTFNEIKAQLRLDDEQAEYEQTLLESYGETAEDAILTIINRDYTDVVSTYGSVPNQIRLAALMLVDQWYNHRSPEEAGTMSEVSYGFDFILKPFMKLTTNNTQDDGRCNL